MKSYIHIVIILCTITASVMAEEPTQNKWISSLDLGYSLQRGNTDSTDFHLKAEVKKTTEERLYRFGAGGAYGTKDDETNTEKANASIEFSQQLSGRSYVSGIASYEYDGMAELDYRFKIGPGYQYFFIFDDPTKLNGEIGPVYVWEKKGDVKDDYPALRIAERYEGKIYEHVSVWESVEYIPSLTESDDYLINAEAGIGVAINSMVNLKVTAKDNYNNAPAEGKKRNDFSLITSVGVTY